MDYRIIAVDFDGTLCYSNWPELGEPNRPLIEYLRSQKDQGNKLILWTCRARQTPESPYASTVYKSFWFFRLGHERPDTQ